MGIFKGRKVINVDSKEDLSSNPSEWNEEYSYDVVGESFARDSLTQLVQGKENEGEIFTNATLRLEPTNQFDPTAVEVLIEDKHVGYIPKHDSEAVTSLIQKTRSDTFLVPARIGWDTDNPMPLIGVSIQLRL